MKIAYLTSVYGRASDTFIRNEVLALRQRGHTVRTYSIRRADPTEEVSAEVRREQHTTDFILLHPRTALLRAFLVMLCSHPRRMLDAFSLAWSTRSPGLKALVLQGIYLVEAAYLAQQMQAHGTQILHNHIAENSATVAMLASRLSGVPFSMTVHGPGIFYDPRRWALADKIRESAFTACITSFCRSQCMVFASPAQFAKLHVVRCGVGQGFTNVAATPVPDAARLVCVGRLCPEKGMLLLIDALARFIAGGGRCELVLIGDGPSRPQIEAAIDAHRLQRSVKLLGWQNSEVIRAEILRSRALVLPSFAEGLPIVLMEALALGRPVITSRIAGIPELVTHRENGWLVSPGCVDELVEAIAQVCSASQETLARMGRRGAMRVRRAHDVDTEAAKLEALFLETTATIGTTTSDALPGGSPAPRSSGSGWHGRSSETRQHLQ